MKELTPSDSDLVIYTQQVQSQTPSSQVQETLLSLGKHYPLSKLPLFTFTFIHIYLYSDEDVCMYHSVLQRSKSNMLGCSLSFHIVDSKTELRFLVAGTQTPEVISHAQHCPLNTIKTNKQTSHYSDKCGI